MTTTHPQPRVLDKADNVGVVVAEPAEAPAKGRASIAWAHPLPPPNA